MNIASWLTDFVTVASVTGTDVQGDATYGAARTLKARVENVENVARRPTGEEVISNHRVITTEPISHSDRVWLAASAGTTAQAKAPISVVSRRDKSSSVTLYTVLL